MHVTDADGQYFEKLELLTDNKFDLGQRAWYCRTRDSTFNGSDEKMWQEYPGTVDEAFQVSGDGYYYSKDMALLRKRGGIRDVLVLDLPVNTFWDIGNRDGCAIWFHQELRGEDRFIDYYEGHNENLKHYVMELTKRGYLFNKHFLPHDAAHRKLSDTNRSTQEQLIGLGLQNTVIVPVITQLIAGVQLVRKHLKGAYIDEIRCKQGIDRLDGYKKRFSRIDSRYVDDPDKSNGCSEGADALRQWAQAKELGMVTLANNPARSNSPPPAPDWRL